MRTPVRLTIVVDAQRMHRQFAAVIGTVAGQQARLQRDERRRRRRAIDRRMRDAGAGVEARRNIERQDRRVAGVRPLDPLGIGRARAAATVRRRTGRRRSAPALRAGGAAQEARARRLQRRPRGGRVAAGRRDGSPGDDDVDVETALAQSGARRRSASPPLLPGPASTTTRPRPRREHRRGDVPAAAVPGALHQRLVRMTSLDVPQRFDRQHRASAGWRSSRGERTWKARREVVLRCDARACHARWRAVRKV